MNVKKKIAKPEPGRPDQVSEARAVRRASRPTNGMKPAPVARRLDSVQPRRGQTRARLVAARVVPPRGYVLITGGAGFIGTNVAERMVRGGRQVLIFDNLSRPGGEQNLHWLREQYGGSARFMRADIRDSDALARAVAGADRIYHFAAQVAVTTSLTAPIEDFDVNARGTLELLECVRRRVSPPPLLFTSTNKVYGALDGLALVETRTSYLPRDRGLREHGASESQRLDFHSPYGCSKGVADQYVLDYARSYELPTVVFRMSCIYGPHQWGTEDQGWVAHFVRQSLDEETITLYGDGRQVRDILFVTDLAEAMALALERIEDTRGRAFNIGGGPKNACSLLELLDLIARLRTGRPLDIQFGNWRTGDQRYYVSDTRRFASATGWRPRVSVQAGVARLYRWLAEHHERRSRPVLLKEGA